MEVRDTDRLPPPANKATNGDAVTETVTATEFDKDASYAMLAVCVKVYVVPATKLRAGRVKVVDVVGTDDMAATAGDTVQAKFNLRLVDVAHFEACATVANDTELAGVVATVDGPTMKS